MKTWAGLLLALVLTQAAAQTEYIDPSGRFRFMYPSSFGSTSAGTNSAGTNNGFGDRVAAVRFSNWSGLGGEAVLTQGAPMLDVQAAGGLYDAIALEIVPDALRASLVKTLPRLTPNNFCQIIAREQHIDATLESVRGLTAQQKEGLLSIDRMRNVDPKVVWCDVRGQTVTFEKEVSFKAGAPRQCIYGAVRFLSGAHSTFQLIRAGIHPDPAVLDQMTAVVNSWSLIAPGTLVK